jgi:hypothetical protein
VRSSAHLLGRRLGHEAGADQAMGQQVRQPERVGDIGLAAGHVLHVRRIGQHQGEVTVGQDVPDRLPINACRLDHQVRAALLGEPG